MKLELSQNHPSKGLYEKAEKLAEESLKKELISSTVLENIENKLANGLPLSDSELVELDR
jgi:hypothetical protein